MLALRYYGVGDIRVENIPNPICNPKEAVVKVKYAGICGSDLHIFRKGMFVKSTPITMGHEFSGVVETIGSEVRELSPGDHVIGDPRVSCNNCKWCQAGSYNLCPELGFIGEVLPGCFAEYIVIDSKKLFKIPFSLNLKEAALVEPLAVALHIIQNSSLSHRDAIGIVGAGPIGILSLLVIQKFYTKNVTVIDISSNRLEKAKILGAHKIMQGFPINSSERVDIVIEAVGSEETLNNSFKWLNPQGKLIMCGLYEDNIKIDPNNILYKELKLIGVNAYETENIRKAIELLSNKYIEVGSIITDILPLSKAVKGFKLLTASDKKSIKVLLAS
ncbi:MAG: hypothetical protein DRH33_07060 [Candidatus Nealsonbacteria bacterium]|nr:MAG: hypothetical protein DRH33_07060 [Candidatus Nealsonbacteria bacterium]